MVDKEKIYAILIPDVHGRVFWKDALPYMNEGVRTIFLGDYLAPYPHENITGKDALENFKEILDTTEDMDNVTLLTGNHDWSYIAPDYHLCDSRIDEERFQDIVSIFLSNLKRFYLSVFDREDGKEKVIFSHAGIHSMWLYDLTADVSDSGILEWSLYDMLKSPDNETVIKYLSHVSPYRWGMNPEGSIIWADINEFEHRKQLDCLQFVGHTMQLKKETTDEGHGWFKWVPDEPVTFGNVTCIDCQQCFWLDQDLKLHKLE